MQSLAMRLAISSRLGSQSEFAETLPWNAELRTENCRCAYATLHCNPSDGSCVNNAWHKLELRQVPSMGQTNWVDSTWVGHFKWQPVRTQKQERGSQFCRLCLRLWRANDIFFVLLTCRTLRKFWTQMRMRGCSLTLKFLLKICK